MPGFLLLAHTPLASALKAAASHAFPDETNQKLLVLDILPHLHIEEIEAQARSALQQAMDKHGQALILTDVFGATPANVAQKLADGVYIKVLTGVNVPMLWRVLNYSHESLDMLVARALAGATQGIMQIAIPRPQNQAVSSHHDQKRDHYQQ